MKRRACVAALATCALVAGAWSSAPARSSAVTADQNGVLFWRGGPAGRYQVLLRTEVGSQRTVRAAFACWSPQSSEPSRLLARVFFARARWRQVRGADVRQPDLVFRVRGRGIGGPATMTGRLSHIPRGNRAISRLTGEFRSRGCDGGKRIRYRIAERCVPALGDKQCGFKPPPQLILRASFSWACANSDGFQSPAVCPHDQMRFRARATVTRGDVVREFRWDFGGGGVDDDERPVPGGVVVRRSSDPEYPPERDVSFTYDTPGTYVVRLRVTTRRGLTTSVQRTLQIVESTPPG